MRRIGRFLVFNTKAHADWCSAGSVQFQWQGHCNKIVYQHGTAAAKEGNEALYKGLVKGVESRDAAYFLVQVAKQSRNKLQE